MLLVCQTYQENFRENENLKFNGNPLFYKITFSIKQKPFSLQSWTKYLRQTLVFM